ncbi:MAG: TrmB family transcriptional regulator [Methanomicrobiales archaeon]|nr:TrmB family transcriptional regulator [Methanomicrobiales archaeon]
MADSPENFADTIESLKSLGLTKYEALVYIALLKVEGASATEIHEISGVPRASVYPVLDRLVQKSLVTVSHSTPRRYNAAPPDEGIERLLRDIREGADRAREALIAIYEKRSGPDRGSQELIWSIHGDENIRTRIADLALHATESIVAVSSFPFLKRSLLPLLEKTGPDMSVVIITDHWEGKTRDSVTVRLLPAAIHNAKPLSMRDTAGMFIFDQKKALVLMGPEKGPLTALYSESPGFISFFLRYFTFIEEIAGDAP